MTPTPLAADPEALLRLLFALGDAIRDRVLAARTSADTPDQLAAIAAVTAADTIYQVDRISEAVIVAWFAAHWPATEPVEVIMEGLEEHGSLTFPAGTPANATRWKCLLDPIDGTRNLMYDKRSAWALAALAPQRGAATNLGDIVVAAMTELPTSRTWRADQVGAVRARGPAGIVAQGRNVLTGELAPLRLRPSPANDFRHGWASLARFFPEGKALTAQIEEELWDRLYGLGRTASPLVFDDQYMTTGGQIYELLAGRDRMLGDLRPLVLPRVGCDASLACHPYDICTAMILEEAGGIVEDARGGPLRAPLDTTTPVAWLGFANRDLADLARPILHDILRRRGLQ